MTVIFHFCLLTSKKLPGDPKPLETSQFPQKVSIQIICIRCSRRESKRKQRLILPFKKVSFLKNTSSFSFFSSPLFCGLDLGKIYANFSGEIVTSSSVVDHRVTGWWSVFGKSNALSKTN